MEMVRTTAPVDEFMQLVWFCINAGNRRESIVFSLIKRKMVCTNKNPKAMSHTILIEVFTRS